MSKFVLSFIACASESQLFMAALRSRGGHYIFVMWFLSIYLLSSIFFLA